MKKRFIFPAIFIAVLFSRLPFLYAGYGADRDAWRVATVARWISETGQYIASRLPGYPIQELSYSILWGKSPWAWNVITAVLSAISAVLLAGIGKRSNCSHYGISALAFAFTPVVYINSTNSMDYVWAIACILAAWYAAMNQKAWIAGILVGLASGCRITSCLMLIPLALILIHKQSRDIKIKRMIALLSSAGVTCAIAFFPVYQRYGFRFLSTSALRYAPLTSLIVRTMILDVWGILGIVGFVCITIWIAWSSIKNHRFVFFYRSSWNITDGAAMLVIILYTILFMGLPLEAGYLIPIIPFFFLLAAKFFSVKRLYGIALFVIASSFFIGFDSVDRPWSPERSAYSSVFKYHDRTLLVDWLHGPIFLEHEKRLQHMNYAKRVLAVADTLSERSVIMCGGWLPYFILATPNAIPDDRENYVLTSGNVDFTAALSSDQYRVYREKKIKIYYLFTTDQYCRDITGFDVLRQGATLLWIN